MVEWSSWSSVRGEPAERGRSQRQLNCSSMTRDLHVECAEKYNAGTWNVGERQIHRFRMQRSSER